MPNKPIVVIGSINMDLACRTPHIPTAGETILGSDFVMMPGGKGANQAVAAAKLGGQVYMVGRVGDDDFGDRLIYCMSAHKVNVEHITVSEGDATGIAMILVDMKGENSIIVAPGANQKLTPDDIDAAESLITTAGTVVMQLEIPLVTVHHVIALCQRHGVHLILDPAPVPPQGLDRAMMDVDLLTPNQGEAEQLVGLSQTHNVSAKKIIDPKQVGSDLLARGARAVVLTLGHKGAMVLTRDGQIVTIPPHKVKVVDTTAAGDAFTGALAVGYSQGMPLATAAKFANAAGALCCTGFGAQPAMPTRAAVDALLLH